jgi:hypothetical protein
MAIANTALRRSASVSRGNGTKRMTKPKANHMVKNRREHNTQPATQQDERAHAAYHLADAVTSKVRT